jgi:hypothetical protein
MRQSLILSLVTLTLLSAPLAAFPEESSAAVWPVSPSGSTLQPVLTTTEWHIGQNRMTFGLLLDHTTCVTDADVIVRVYALQDAQPRLQTEMRACYEPLTGSGRGLQTEPEMDGLYVAQVTFETLDYYR